MSNWSNTKKVNKEKVYLALLKAADQVTDDAASANIAGLSEQVQALMNDNDALMAALDELGFPFKAVDIDDAH